jgi:hypothetical protein
MDKRQTSEEILQTQIQRARQAAEIADQSEPRAIAAHYDPQADLIVIYLKSGAIFSFPPAIAQGLTLATPAELNEIEITPSGDGLHWEKLDIDFSLPRLLAGVFGDTAWTASDRSEIA